MVYTRNMIDPSLQSTIINFVKYAQKLETISRFKDKEIERLEHLNKYLVLIQEKRDEMLQHTLEENRKLKERSLRVEIIKHDKKNMIRPKNFAYSPRPINLGSKDNSPSSTTNSIKSA